jgi:polar amino acid transport system substrate-binding protein
MFVFAEKSSSLSFLERGTVYTQQIENSRSRVRERFRAVFRSTDTFLTRAFNINIVRSAEISFQHSGAANIMLKAISLQKEQNMRKILFILFIIIFVTNSVGAGEKISGCGGLAYPPFMWKEGDKIVGVGTEVAQIVFGELGLGVESVCFSSWNRCMREVEKGRVDIFFAASVNEERAEFADFTKNYLSEVPVGIFVWKERPIKFEKWEDLIGKKMGCILGTTYGQKFDDFAAKNLETSEVITPIQNLKKLEKGRVDFLPIGLYTGQIHVKQFGYNDKIVALDSYLETGYLYVGISKLSPYLKHLPYVDKRLLELRNDGTVKQLVEKYIDYYVETAK